MKPTSETARGIEYLRTTFESSRTLKLVGPEDLLGNGYAFYFEVHAYGKQWYFSMTREELSDLPNMERYRESALALAHILEKRFENTSPDMFLTATGNPVQIHLVWPLRAVPGKFASGLEARIFNTRTGQVARCFIVLTYQDRMSHLKEDPFQLHEAIVNSLRRALDLREITFYASLADLPPEMRPVEVRIGSTMPDSVEIGSFLKQKVMMLGFRAGNRETRVWIGDPWDADYLGVRSRDLLQEAEILEAEDYVKLDASRQFANAGSKLLVEARKRTQPELSARPKSHDVFLSHASEDKNYVRELASALDRRGISYWLDEFQITLGDSLRRVIDTGLANSRFGIVILSKHFFAKEWPQRELDGLLALEIEEKVILPVWHEISEDEVKSFSPSLAGRFAAKTTEGIETVADKIATAIGKN
jgi:hypothetical protein